jgi:hypothetical protein
MNAVCAEPAARGENARTLGVMKSVRAAVHEPLDGLSLDAGVLAKIYAGNGLMPLDEGGS